MGLCVALLQALLQAQPVQDASLPPWVRRDLAQTGAAAAFSSLLTVVVALGLGANANAQRPGTDASARLRLASQLVNARLPSFVAATKSANADDALAAELAFVFRHA